MDRKELAILLDKREYRNETNSEIETIAKENNLVIVFGYSDDLLEFRGSIDDEVGAWNGTIVNINNEGIIKSECDEGEHCPYFQKEIENSDYVKSIWCPDDLDTSWLITSNIPFSSFDIFEDEELYCRGIVFNLNDVNN